MTAPEMLAQIEGEYRATLASVPGHKYPAPVPESVTAHAWDFALAPGQMSLPAAEFLSKWAQPIGKGLALQGMDWGLDHFAKLTVEDRPEAKVKGHTKTHKRPRAFVVRALGWKGQS